MTCVISGKAAPEAQGESQVRPYKAKKEGEIDTPKQFKDLRGSGWSTNSVCQGFPGGAVVKNPPAIAGDAGSSPGPGRSHMPRSN